MTQSSNGGSSQPVFQSPAVVVAVIAVLAAIHGALWLLGENWQAWTLYNFAFIPARLCCAAFPHATGSEVWTFLTYGLLHGSWGHLGANSLWLLIFGTPVARFLGPWRFLLLAVASTVAGAMAALLAHWDEVYIMVGASGAVSGLMGAAVPIMFGSSRGWRKAMIGQAGATHPLPPRLLVGNRNAVVFSAVWLAITLISGAWGWTGNSFVADGGIAWEAHIGGFLGGLVAFYALWPDWMRGA